MKETICHLLFFLLIFIRFAAGERAHIVVYNRQPLCNEDGFETYLDFIPDKCIALKGELVDKLLVEAGRKPMKVYAKFSLPDNRERVRLQIWGVLPCIFTPALDVTISKEECQFVDEVHAGVKLLGLWIAGNTPAPVVFQPGTGETEWQGEVQVEGFTLDGGFGSKCATEYSFTVVNGACVTLESIGIVPLQGLAGAYAKFQCWTDFMQVSLSAFPDCSAEGEYQGLLATFPSRSLTLSPHTDCDESWVTASAQTLRVLQPVLMSSRMCTRSGPDTPASDMQGDLASPVPSIALESPAPSIALESPAPDLEEDDKKQAAEKNSSSGDAVIVTILIVSFIAVLLLGVAFFVLQKNARKPSAEGHEMFEGRTEEQMIPMDMAE